MGRKLDQSKEGETVVARELMDEVVQMVWRLDLMVCVYACVQIFEFLDECKDYEPGRCSYNI